MIYVNYQGRLGNNLFQWGFGRILSKLTGVPMCAARLRLFPATAGKIHWGVSHLFSRMAKGERMLAPRIPFLPVARAKFQIPMEKITSTFPDNPASSTLQEWVEKAKQGDILVQGYPHRISFFQPHAHWLTRELTPKDGDYARVSSDDIVIHVRWGDYFEHPPHVEPFGYPLDAMPNLLASLSYDRCLIVTDTPDNELTRKLIKESRGIVIAKDMAHDYRTLYHAPRIVLSPSTFSWWPAWTGKAREIYQPHEMGLWKKANGFEYDLPGIHVRRFDGSGRILPAIDPAPSPSLR
jgi:hypothetical protein